MKKIVLSVLALSLIQTATLVQAAELKIGYVNTERVFREASPAQKAQKKLEKEFASRDQELMKLIKQAKEIQAGLERDGVTVAESERRNRERELANLNRDIQRSQRELREDLNLRRNEELSAVQERANKAIIAIAESEKFDLILQEAVFASTRIDVTDKVIKALSDK